MKTEILKKEKQGKYIISFCKDKTYRIKDSNSNNKKIFYVPSDNALKQRYKEDLKKGRMSQTTKTFLAYRGVVFSGQKSVMEGKEALGLSIRQTMVVEQVKKSIEDFWPCSHLNLIKNHRAEYFLKIKDYREKYPKEVNFIYRRFKNFKKGLKQIGSPYDKIYDYVLKTTSVENIDKAELKNILQERFNSGELISASALKSSKIKIWNQLRILAYLDKKSVTEIICQLTGFSKEDVEITRGQIKKISFLTEKIVSFVFHWAENFNYDIRKYPSGVLEGPRNKITLLFDGKTFLPDLRVCNIPVEVKSYLTEFTPQKVKTMIKKYQQTKTWKTGEKVDNPLVILHQKQENYKEQLNLINNSGFDIMCHQEFYGYLEEIVKKIKKDPNLVSGIFPKPNLEYLLKLDKETLSSFGLLKKENKYRLDWSLKMVNSLIDRAVEIPSNKMISYPKDIPVFPQNTTKIIKNKKGSFLIFKDEQIKATELIDYFNQNKSSLNYSGAVPLFKNINQKKVIAFDLETLGLSYSDPIISVGYTELNKGKRGKAEALFARDPSEELPMIFHTLKMLNQADLILSFNGKTFDMPRLKKRANINGLTLNGSGFDKIIKDIEQKHVDLFPLIKKDFTFRGRNLTTLEKIIFNFERQGDLPSKQIPEVYENFLMNGKEPEKVQSILEHNIIDTMSLISLLAYTCKNH